MNNIAQHWQLVGATQEHKRTRSLIIPWSCAFYSHSGSLQSICEILLTWNGNFFTSPSGIKWKLVPLLSYICVAQMTLPRRIILFNFLPGFLRKQVWCKQAVSPPSPSKFQPPCSLSIKFDRDLKTIKLWEVLCKSVSSTGKRDITQPF